MRQFTVLIHRLSNTVREIGVDTYGLYISFRDKKLYLPGKTLGETLQKAVEKVKSVFPDGILVRTDAPFVYQIMPGIYRIGTQYAFIYTFAKSKNRKSIIMKRINPNQMPSEIKRMLEILRKFTKSLFIDENSLKVLQLPPH